MLIIRQSSAIILASLVACILIKSAAAQTASNAAPNAATTAGTDKTPEPTPVTPPLDPVPCMSIASEDMDSLYASMKDVVLSIQVCVSESRFTDAAELYFITWPILSFNQEVTRNDQVNYAYINALDASLRHYFAEMSEAEQDALLNEFDAIVTDPDNRRRMCSHLTSSAPPFIDIRQQPQVANQLHGAEKMWQKTVMDYGCS